MRRRGFTMIELCIVVGIMALITTSFLSQFLCEYGLFHQMLARTDQHNEAALAAARTFQHARGGYRIDTDNHGLTFKDGARVRWEGQALTWTAPRIPARRLTSDPVLDFTVVKQGSDLVLNLALANSRVNSRLQRPSTFTFVSGTDTGP